MRPHTLFLTNREDISIEYLIEKYRQRSDSYLRINSDDFGALEFGVNPSGAINIIVEGVEYDLTTIKSVLFKRVPSKFLTPENEEDRPWLNNECEHFLEGLYLIFSEAKWINPMFATHIAERKLYQLHVANRFNLSTPKSIMTNRSSTALQFLKDNTASIIKPVSNGLQVLKEKTYSSYTTEISPKEFRFLNLAETFDTPVFLQEKITNAADIRVTIVGQHLLAVKITKESNEVDWRKPEVKKHYSEINLPTDLEQKLLSFVDFFKMVYSVIDLILTPDGKYIFLEINPVGEWVLARA